MATISRFKAVALIGRFRLTGFVAWLAWLALHLIYITGFKSRLTALMHWFVSFLGRGRSERTTTEQQIYARAALQRLQGGAADLVSSPGAYDRAQEILEVSRAGRARGPGAGGGAAHRLSESARRPGGSALGPAPALRRRGGRPRAPA